MTDSEKVPFAVELLVSNFKNSLDFYTSLGFNIHRIDEKASFAVLTFHSALLMIWHDVQPMLLGNGVDLRFMVDGDLREYYNKVAGKGIEIVSPYTETSYGISQFTVKDPDGYRLRFCA